MGRHWNQSEFEEFVKMYRAGASFRSLAEHFKLPEANMRSKAQYLRRLGVALDKRVGGEKRTVDVAKLNSL